jgi:biopolymer transport protein ExbB/TolQ
MSFLFAGSVGSSPNSVGSEFSEALQELARPWPEGDKLKQRIDRAARAAGLHYWRAFDIWYRKARRIDAHEAAKINEALRLKREKAVANEYHDLKARLAKLESRLLVQGNPNVHR